MAPEGSQNDLTLSGGPCPRTTRVAAIAAFAVFGLAAAALLTAGRPTPAVTVCGIIFGLAALLGPLYLVLEARSRGYRVTPTVLECRGGLLTRHDVTVALRHVGGVSVRQGWIQRLIGCGDVRVFAHGIGASTGLVTTTADMHSICLRSIRDFQSVGALLRRRVDTGSRDAE